MKLLKFRKYEIRAREERPEGAMSPQPRATPWVEAAKSDFRPERANLGAARANKLVCLAESRQDKTKSKALQSVADAFKFPSEWNAFALSGRKMMCDRDTQGAALGWGLSALSGRSSLSGLVFFTSET